MVYVVGSTLKVTSEILRRDNVRDTVVSRILQSGIHKIVAETEVSPHATQVDLYSPTNVIAIRSDSVILESILRTNDES